MGYFKSRDRDSESKLTGIPAALYLISIDFQRRHRSDARNMCHRSKYVSVLKKANNRIRQKYVNIKVFKLHSSYGNFHYYDVNVLIPNPVEIIRYYTCRMYCDWGTL